MRHRTAKQEYFHDYSRVIKARCFALYGSKCYRCGFSDERALQIEHIIAYVFKPTRNRGSIALYLDILSGRERKEDFQLSCANCNWIKRAENDENKGIRNGQIQRNILEGIDHSIVRELIERARRWRPSHE